MVLTRSELDQAQAILFKIRSGISVRTDPRSPIGAFVNKALEGDITRQESLIAQEKAGLLEDKPKSQEIARRLIAGEELQTLAQEGTGIVIVDGKPFPVPKEEQTRFLRQQFELGKTQFITGQEALRFAEEARARGEAIVTPEVKRPSALRSIFLEPAFSPSEIRELPPEQRGREAAKSIFLGGLRGIQEKLRRGESLASQVAGELTPTSAAELLVLRFLPTLPKPIQNVLLGGIAVITAPVIFEKDRDKSQRIAAGIIAGGASAGILINILPTLFKSNIFSSRFFPKGKIRLVPRGKKGEARFAELAQFFEKEQKKIRFEDVARDLQFKRVGNVIRPKTNAEKIADIKKIIDEVNRIKDPVTRDVQMKSAIELFKKTYGETEATSLIKDLITQEAPPQTIAELGRLPSPPRELPAPTAQIPFFSFLDKPMVSQLRPSEKQLFLTKTTTKQLQTQLQKDVQAIQQAQLIAQTPAQRQRLGQALKSAQKQLQVQKQISKQVQALSTKNIFFRARAKPIRLKPKPKPKIPKKILILPKGVSKTKLVKALVKLKKQGVNVVVGQGKKQKIIARNLPPFKALKKGRDFVDENIEASFRLVKSEKKAKVKDITPFNIGRKFRPSKRNVLIQVEKSKFRLDHPKEVAQLKAAKRRKPIKKKRKKKK